MTPCIRKSGCRQLPSKPRHIPIHRGVCSAQPGRLCPSLLQQARTTVSRQPVAEEVKIRRCSLSHPVTHSITPSVGFLLSFSRILWPSVSATSQPPPLVRRLSGEATTPWNLSYSQLSALGVVDIEACPNDCVPRTLFDTDGEVRSSMPTRLHTPFLLGITIWPVRREAIVLRPSPLGTKARTTYCKSTFMLHLVLAFFIQKKRIVE